MAGKKKVETFPITVSVPLPLVKIIDDYADGQKRKRSPQCLKWIEEKIEQLKKDGEIK